MLHDEVAGATCAGCQGAGGIGTPVGADLTLGTWLWGDGSVQRITNIMESEQGSWLAGEKWGESAIGANRIGF